LVSWPSSVAKPAGAGARYPSGSIGKTRHPGSAVRQFLPAADRATDETNRAADAVSGKPQPHMLSVIAGRPGAAGLAGGPIMNGRMRELEPRELEAVVGGALYGATATVFRLPGGSPADAFAWVPAGGPGEPVASRPRS
jgi:hypothetical protein